MVCCRTLPVLHKPSASPLALPRGGAFSLQLAESGLLSASCLDGRHRAPGHIHAAQHQRDHQAEHLATPVAAECRKGRQESTQQLPRSHARWCSANTPRKCTHDDLRELLVTLGCHGAFSATLKLEPCAFLPEKACAVLRATGARGWQWQPSWMQGWQVPRRQSSWEFRQSIARKPAQSTR